MERTHLVLTDRRLLNVIICHKNCRLQLTDVRFHRLAVYDRSHSRSSPRFSPAVVMTYSLKTLLGTLLVPILVGAQRSTLEPTASATTSDRPLFTVPTEATVGANLLPNIEDPQVCVDRLEGLVVEADISKGCGCTSGMPRVLCKQREDLKHWSDSGSQTGWPGVPRLWNRYRLIIVTGGIPN